MRTQEDMSTPSFTLASLDPSLTSTGLAVFNSKREVKVAGVVKGGPPKRMCARKDESSVPGVLEWIARADNVDKDTVAIILC